MLPPLSNQEKRELLKLARAAITQAVVQNQLPGSPMVSGRLAEFGSAFITIFCLGQLRGCVGHAGRTLSLAETVVQAAVSASRNDPRFAPLTPDELNDVIIEISVLSQPERINPNEIEIGKHGLLIVRDAKRGLLLPQVAIEHAFDAQRFLDETCRKAGLPPNAWRDPETTVMAFTAEVFSEKEFPCKAPEHSRTND
jgi:AmmeMemoRadiSam system protein A